MKIWYAEGLEEAIHNHTVETWIKNYFGKNSREICFEGCQTIVSSESDDPYYTIEMNGNDKQEISFIVQDSNVENLHHFHPVHDNSTVLHCFYLALSSFNVYVEKLQHSIDSSIETLTK